LELEQFKQKLKRGGFILMGQAEIIEILKKKDNWMSIDEINSSLKNSKAVISARLNRLLKFNEVKRRLVTREQQKQKNPNKKTTHAYYEYKIIK